MPGCHGTHPASHQDRLPGLAPSGPMAGDGIQAHPSGYRKLLCTDTVHNNLSPSCPQGSAGTNAKQGTHQNSILMMPYPQEASRPLADLACEIAAANLPARLDHGLGSFQQRPPACRANEDLHPHPLDEEPCSIEGLPSCGPFPFSCRGGGAEPRAGGFSRCHR